MILMANHKKQQEQETVSNRIIPIEFTIHKHWIQFIQLIKIKINFYLNKKGKIIIIIKSQLLFSFLPFTYNQFSRN